jgi:N-carbamoylputrescine amidase
MAETVRVGLVQQRCGSNPQLNLTRALEAMDRAADAGVNLIAFAELALTKFFPQHPRSPEADQVAEPIPGATANAIAAKSREHALVTVFNMYERDVESGKCYDSSPVFDADGALLGVTRMVHITDYACFHEKAYYAPGDNGAPVYETAVGRLGVAICYDRHYPEYMRALGVAGAQLVVIPQAGAVDEWPEGLYEAEVRTAAFQNGYFTALCNRVGEEDRLTFAGESFVVNPRGTVVARARKLDEDLLITDIDLSECETSQARTLFWRDRRPDLYAGWLEP